MLPCSRALLSPSLILLRTASFSSPLCSSTVGAAPKLLPSIQRRFIMTKDESLPVEEIVCKFSDVPENGKKEIELRGRKILLINDAGSLSAVNALCPHFDLPLINAVVSGGKIRCAYHGACFDLKTGDIEDFPGLDSLHSYKVDRVGDDIVIRTSEKQLESTRRSRHSCLRSAPRKEEKPIVVVGGGPAGHSAVEHLRLAGWEGPITLLTKEATPPYDRVPLTKIMTIPARRFRDDDFYSQQHIDVRCNSEVVGLDADSHSISLAGGSTVQYSKLILALGGAVRKLPVPGGDLENVFTLRTIEDTHAIWTAAEGKDVVCIGGSFTGMEAAASLKPHAKSIIVISTTPEPFPALGEDVGGSLRKYFATKGVEVRTSARVVEIVGNESGGTKEVVLETGERLPAEVVVIGIGTDPDTKWLSQHGVGLDEGGFIKVNADFETNLPGVFAIGDVVTAPLPLWDIDSINIQHFQTAQRHGHLAAYSVIGKPQPGHVIPYFWTHVFGERGVQFSGCAHGADETIVHGDLEEFTFRKFYFRKGLLVAVMKGGTSTTHAIQFLAMAADRRRITKEEIEGNPTDDWSVYFE